MWTHPFQQGQAYWDAILGTLGVRIFIPSKILILNPNHQGDDIAMWGFGDVVR